MTTLPLDPFNKNTHLFHLEHTGWAKKTAPNFSCNNVGKYGPILIMFSLLHSQIN